MPRTTSIREIDKYEGLQAKTHRGDRRHHGVRHTDMWGASAQRTRTNRTRSATSVLNAYNALNGNGMITEADKGQGDRGQSYSYAAASHGDWVYIGTMYGGLGVQAILNHGMASNMGMSAEAAKNLMQTMYAGHMYLGEPDGKSAGGMLFKFNVKTGETKILMSKSAGIEGGKGIIPTFRSAFEMNGKLYFEGMVMDTANPDLDQREIQTAIAMQNGFPCIYEIDPANGDKLTIVHNSVDTEGFRTLVNQKVFTSTRAIGSFNDTLIAGDLKIDANGNGAAYLVASNTPSVPGSYKVIADMASFDNLPAIHRSDVNGGGGIYQVLEFNGKLYVVVCTGSADTRNEQTGTLRSFAIYVGENNGDATNKADWSWRPLVGDPTKGAKYFYGLDSSRVSAGACTLQVFGDHLYIGDYNDVSSALAALLAYERTLDDVRVLVQCNFSGDEQPALATEGSEVLVSNYEDESAGVLRPWEGTARIWR